MEAFLDQVQEFGLANWIVIACVALSLIMMIILVLINIRIMKKYRGDLNRARLGRVVARIENINGWCCAVIENVGASTASNIKVSVKGSILKYYRNYITTCRLPDVLKETIGKKMTLAPNQRKQIRLFPVTDIVASRDKVTKAKFVADADVNFTAHTASEELEVTQLVDADDARIIKVVAKDQKKLVKTMGKQDKKFSKQYNKMSIKKQKALNKLNKKLGRKTHTSFVERPDMSLLMKRADATFKLKYESLGYYMKKNVFKYKNLDLNTYPQELTASENIIMAQNDLLKQMIVLQQQVATMLGNKSYVPAKSKESKNINEVPTEDQMSETISSTPIVSEQDVVVEPVLDMENVGEEVVEEPVMETAVEDTIEEPVAEETSASESVVEEAPKVNNIPRPVNPSPLAK